MLNKMNNLLQLPFTKLPINHIIAFRDGQAIHNGEFLTYIQQWHALLDQSIGTKFAVYINDSVQFTSALFGAWLAGKTVYLPNNILPNTCDSLHNLVDGFLGDFPQAYSPLKPNGLYLNNNYNFHQAKLDGNQEGLVIYTSGSTGVAQAIPKRLAQLATEINTLEQLFGEKLGQAEIIATVAHEHIYGLLFKILWPLTAGRAFHLRSFIHLAELLPLITTRKCILVSTPAHLKRLPNNSINSFIQIIFSSGSLLPLEVAQAIGKNLGHIPIEIYGSSETGGIAWRQHAFASTLEQEWQPLPGVMWRIAIETNVLEIQSPHLRDSQWICTHDQATSTNNTTFLLQGRCDRIVKLEGKRISLDAIERQLILSPLVTEARILMLDNHRERQRIAAVIVLSEVGRATLANKGKTALNHLLRNTLINSVELIALPRSWRYVDALPINTQGKTTLANLMTLFAKNNHLRPTKPETRLLEHTAQRVILELNIIPELLYFIGHFPNTPILPGVAQLDWAIHFGYQYFALPTKFLGIRALKFQQIIQPGMIVQLELQYDPVKSILTFRIYSPAGQHASGRILFGIF